MQTIKAQRTSVQLPSDSFVSHWQLTRAIAEAFFPDRRQATGVTLVTHKALRSGPGEGLPYKLTDRDRAILAKHAGRLPSLAVTSSDADWGAFLEAFARLEPELNWEPSRPSEADLYADYCEGKAIADEHLQSLRSLLADGKIRAINDQRVPVSVMAADTLIARADLEKYLTGCQINFTVARPPPRAMLESEAPDLQLEPVVHAAQQFTHTPQAALEVVLELVPLEASAPLRQERPLAASPTKKGRDPRGMWTDEAKADLSQRHAAGVTFDRLAHEYEVTPERIGQVVREYNERHSKAPTAPGNPFSGIGARTIHRLK